MIIGLMRAARMAGTMLASAAIINRNTAVTPNVAGSVGLMPNTKSTVELFKRHGFSPVFKESPGGHTWLNWRAYLIEFAPQLF